MDGTPANADVDAKTGGSSQPAPQAIVPPWLGIGLVVCVLVAMILAAVVSIVRGPTGPWRGQWYDGEEFEGDPKVRYTRKIEFDWGRDSPAVSGLGRDKWSVRFHTCMSIDEAMTVRVKTRSDDGSRVWIGGEQVVDNWGAHATRTRTGKIDLEEGTHLVRVDYFEASHGANLEVTAAFDSTDFESIPVKLLSQPSKDNTCDD